MPQLCGEIRSRQGDNPGALRHFSLALALALDRSFIAYEFGLELIRGRRRQNGLQYLRLALELGSHKQMGPTAESRLTAEWNVSLCHAALGQSEVLLDCMERVEDHGPMRWMIEDLRLDLQDLDRRGRVERTAMERLQARFAKLSAAVV